MRVLVTGGAGFIGSHVVDLLFRHGHEVLVVDNFSTGQQENLNPAVLIKVIDVRSTLPLLSLFEEFKPQAVLHLAAQASIAKSYMNAGDDMEVNGIGTLNVLRGCVLQNVHNLVFASTSAVYSDVAKKSITEYGTKLQPGSPYGISKLAAEQYVRLFVPQAVILRLGNVYGPRQVPVGENQVIARMIRHLKYQEPFQIFGDGKQERDFVYVEDVARAFYAGMGGKPGVYNIAWSQTTSVSEVAEIMGDLYGFPHYEWKHDYARQDARRMVWLDTTLAGQDLHWQAETRLLDGLQKTIEWWNDREV